MAYKECVECGSEFDLQEKEARAKRECRAAGKANLCYDCSTDIQVYTGVMIYGHKTAGAIQINKDPRLTEYMLATSPSSGSRHCMVKTLPGVKNASVYTPDTVSKGK